MTKQNIINEGRFGNLKMIQKLIDLKIDLNSCDSSDEKSILVWQCRYQKLDNIKLLLDNGADVNYVSSTTALHEAVLCENLDVVKLLLKHGADINIVDKDGETPLASYIDDITTRSHINKKLIKYLIKHGADVNTYNQFGYPIIQMLYDRDNHYKLLKLLFKCTNNIDINIKNKNGDTIFDKFLNYDDLPYNTIKILKLLFHHMNNMLWKQQRLQHIMVWEQQRLQHIWCGSNSDFKYVNYPIYKKEKLLYAKYHCDKERIVNMIRYSYSYYYLKKIDTI